MEVEITYKAKDGRRFQDPYQCEEYEKAIGVLPNSVADVILQLEKRNPKNYIFGAVFVRHNDGMSSIYTRATACCDSVLEDYVNVNDILEEKRYMTATVEELIETLKEEVQDAPAQYFIVYDDNLEFSHPGIMASHNPLVWKK